MHPSLKQNKDILMNNTPLVSVIVPIYMVEDYLEKAVNSILRQTYNNLEIILIDDGSTDNCPKICDTYKSLDHRIIVIHQDNVGVADARNVGLDIAKGQFIVFVDSDDYIHPRMIEILIAPILEGKAQMSVCSYKEVWTKDTEENEESIAIEYTFLKNRQEKWEYFFGNKMTEFVVAWNKIYPRKFFSEIRFPSGRFYEDEVTICKLLDKAGIIAYIEKPLYYYLRREDSITLRPYGRHSLDKLVAYKGKVSYHMQKKYYDWAERDLYQYKLQIIRCEKSIKECDETFKEDYLNALKEYRNTVKSSVFKLPISLKRKIAYIASAYVPSFYNKYYYHKGAVN